MLDKTLRNKLLAVKQEDRIFTLEFPFDTNTAELYGIVKEIKEELWKSLEEEKKKETDEFPKEDIESTEVPCDETLVEEIKEAVAESVE